ncbi:DUF362 domain-containing protein [Candidatus Bathyarchaeota archaeon]|nr:DUF362 domain-containing protein [Candidatus Bathyarchaeota archaeon]MBS7630500.1 DUF362 domain-containing protein [Candidatus Bathyarchaeota archaeon]
MSIVAIVKGENPQEMTVRALEMVEAKGALTEDKPVLVKPNYINSRHPSTGITTDSRVIEGVILFLKQCGVNEIIIGEGSGHSDTFEAFRNAGVDAVAERIGAKLVDLNRDEFVEVHPPNPLALRKVKIARTALESMVISVPKLKVHRITGVTLSVKNIMGVMTPKGSMHIALSKNIADLASVVKPRVSVIDGIIAGEGHETSGDPVEMNLVIAGLDPVAVDTVGASVMGVPVSEVKHLLYAAKKGLGTYDLNKIKVVGERIEDVRKVFKRSLSSKLLSHLA